jgi:cobalamin biosynthetic protein CobC
MRTSIGWAKRQKVMAMVSHLSPDLMAPLVHGGDLASARRRFPGAPEPFIDLSTGINPFTYPVPELSYDVFARLPEPSAVVRLAAVAAHAYGAPSAAHVAVAPGTQILLPQVARLAPPGRALVLSPTYAEHARAAALAGHCVSEVSDVGHLGDGDLAVVVNPNNPDGRIIARDALIALANELSTRRGLLVVDEAFMDVAPVGKSLAQDVGRGNIVVLRSFGKFFGLAGLRLGFALAHPEIVVRLSTVLGPWAVAGPAIAIGGIALTDAPWVARTRKQLAEAAVRLDTVLAEAGWRVAGGTPLFRLVKTRSAIELWDHLGRAGILVRSFVKQSTWLRFGLPANESAWSRLRAALAASSRLSQGQ